MIQRIKPTYNIIKVPMHYSYVALVISKQSDLNRLDVEGKAPLVI